MIIIQKLVLSYFVTIYWISWCEPLNQDPLNSSLFFLPEPSLLYLNLPSQGAHTPNASGYLLNGFWKFLFLCFYSSYFLSLRCSPSVSIPWRLCSNLPLQNQSWCSVTWDISNIGMHDLGLLPSDFLLIWGNGRYYCQEMWDWEGKYIGFFFVLFWVFYWGALSMFFCLKPQLLYCNNPFFVELQLWLPHPDFTSLRKVVALCSHLPQDTRCLSCVPLTLTLPAHLYEYLHLVFLNLSLWECYQFLLTQQPSLSSSIGNWYRHLLCSWYK